ncbi:sugar kinase and transcription regulator [Paucilactobacillus oligofermentans DSM 15707 = LMG 22743]|uniref:Sugar kinase and transcription regulator n=1 Tax=Paucilactobacillus oligofermentans DSM 15707 = LMG 22743 TaxID=1423778 RepID=A0A0R1RMA1_9LACO|nr:ROK family protein [Paucilactobacillus oligofermentans]KRL55722.1 sugar kinase and transcription regulator [Paucilactobacillus oligofermentans DSM 15707 = LMG 22743]CUS27058.1 Putative N-acylmannosamine kinase 2 [Paucilactobacillus oligofermentans DSM 15707 = LMG 22743]
MKKIALIDVGGTSIKFGTWDGTNLKKYNSEATPDNLEDFYKVLKIHVASLRDQAQIVGVGISIPGAVNKQTGQIEGTSALNYIHYFNIKAELERQLGLSVTIENDANCAALAEVTDGAGKDVNNLLFIVLGTGVGGAVIFDNHIWHGKHLLGGEFGYMLVDNSHILSDVGSPVKVGQKFTKEKNNGQVYEGKEVFDLAEQGDLLAKKEVDYFYRTLARVIFNLQYSFDPEKIIIGGGISNNDHLISNLNREIELCQQQSKIGVITPNLVVCKYTDAANLRGAAVDFITTYPDAIKE